MKRRLVALPDDLDAALTALQDREGPALLPDEVIQAALREYLAARGYIPPTRPLRITPAGRGSGVSDISAEHHRYFAEG